jgi:hypothetical protein
MDQNQFYMRFRKGSEYVSPVLEVAGRVTL